jgi:hypothetical protein
MDAHDRTAWAAVEAALAATMAVLFTSGDARPLRVAAIGTAILASYVLLSFFVPLPLIKTLHQRAADRPPPDPRRVFVHRLEAERERGRALLGQRIAEIFDESTQAEEESHWAWGVVSFLEEAVGKETAFKFEERVMTFAARQFHVDIVEALAFIDEFLTQADSIALRPRFDSRKWATT